MNIPDINAGFCDTCYRSSVQRVTRGYEVTRNDGKGITAYPPLDEVMAAAVWAAARRHLANRGGRLCLAHQAARAAA